MKRLCGLIIAFVLIATCVYGQQTTFTGNDYLKLTPKQRVTMVSKMINDAGAKGIAIQKSPKYYCKSLDAFYAKSPAMKAQPFTEVLKTLMVMEYDWDQPGIDKDTLAKKTLGEDLYKSNKSRIQNQKK